MPYKEYISGLTTPSICDIDSINTDTSVNHTGGLLLHSSHQSMSEENILRQLATKLAYRTPSKNGLECCIDNKHICEEMGLLQRASVWSMMEILVTQLDRELTKTIVFNLLAELLENGDCQSFVISIEIIRQEVDSYNLELSWCIPRQREGYIAYIELLNRFGFFILTTSLLKHSDDTYLIQLSKSDVIIFTSCSQCGKELTEGLSTPICLKCKRITAICCYCNLPVKGLLHWCPVCAHGGHIKCMKLWFKSFDTCASGCGHNCQRKSLEVIPTYEKKDSSGSLQNSRRK
jgi:Zinc-ribbon, C4HC2 type